tara:strand:- start:29 stop:439 length:411 start_codon:yes stop_codon:yes gene_type:complete
MDIFKVEYPVIIEGCKPFLDMYNKKFVDDKFIIRCLEDEEGMVIIVYLQEKYNLFADFKNICVNDQFYKFNTDEKMENELSKYEYGFEIVITKTGYAIEFGIYDNTTKKMILFINSFPYVFKKNKWVRDFNLDFNM